MQKNSITNKITQCCSLPFSVVYWWVSNLNLSSEADRQFIISKISQKGIISIDAWKVLINSGELETDASLTKAEFLAWFDCGNQPSCPQLKLIIEGYKLSNYNPSNEYGVGWTEITTFEDYNDKIIKKVVQYVGGVGVVPSELTDNVNKYYASNGGFTIDKNLATNFRADAEGITFGYKSGINKLNTDFIQIDKAIASNGNVATVVGAISIVMLPLKSNTTYTLSGFLSSASKFMAMKNAASVTVGSVITLTAGNKTFVTPSEETFLNIYGKLVSEGDNWDDNLMLNEGSSALPHEVYSESIIKINNKSIIAEINNDDLTTEEVNVSENLNNPLFLMQNTVVGSTGNVITSSSYINGLTIGLPVLDLIGESITISGHVPNAGKYIVFKNSSNVTVGVLESLSTAEKTLIVPVGAVMLYYYVRLNTDSTPLPNIMINKGVTALPYEAYADPELFITEIKNIKIKGADGGGGQTYDQSLNTNDDVMFNSVNAGQLTTSLLVANLPTNIADVDTGEVWIDTTTGNTLKVK